MALRSRLTVLRLATLALLGLSLVTSVSPAGATEWTGGQTASYTVRVPHGPSYRVAVPVPAGLTLETEREGLIVTNGCFTWMPQKASLLGRTFERALRYQEGRRTATGHGTGLVRWAEFTDEASEDSYNLYAVDPRLVKRRGARDREYFGFHVAAASWCLPRSVARELVQTVRLTPLRG